VTRLPRILGSVGQELSVELAQPGKLNPELKVRTCPVSSIPLFSRESLNKKRASYEPEASRTDRAASSTPIASIA